MELKRIGYLRRKLEQKRSRVLTRYQFYDMKNITRDFGISTPPDLRNWFSVLGWCGKGVDSLADRIVFREFKNDNFGLNEIYDLNSPDVLFDAAVLGATVSSCDFIYIVPDDEGYPRLQVIDGANATGEIDPTTEFLTEGYAVLKRNSENNRPSLEAYFEPYKTTYVFENGKQRTFTHPVAYPLLVPIIYRPDALRPFGRSRISRACMSIVGSAIRSIKRSEISAEFYSFPQKYVTGLSQDTEIRDKWKAAMDAILYITNDENGNHPVLGQFQQQSMSPHFDQLRMFASLFAGEVGLTLNDLGFADSSPVSEEAIKASHENLRLTARKAQRTFGTGFLNAGMLAASLRDEFPYKRESFYDTKIAWYPVFEPDFSSLSQAGDAMLKLNQAFPDYITAEKFSEITGW